MVMATLNSRWRGWGTVARYGDVKCRCPRRLPLEHVAESVDQRRASIRVGLSEAPNAPPLVPTVFYEVDLGSSLFWWPCHHLGKSKAQSTCAPP